MDASGTGYDPQWSNDSGYYHQGQDGSSHRQHGSGFVSTSPYTPNTQHHGSHFLQPQQCYDQYGHASGTTPYAPQYASAPAAVLEHGALFNTDTGSWYNAPHMMASCQPVPSASSSTPAMYDPGNVLLLQNQSLQNQLTLLQDEFRAVRRHLAAVEKASAESASVALPTAFQRSAPFAQVSIAPAPATRASASPGDFLSTISIKSLDSETVRSLRAAGGDLRPETIEKFVERFRNRMATRHQAVRYLLALSSHEQQRYLAAQPDAALPGGTLFAGDLVAANQ